MPRIRQHEEIEGCDCNLIQCPYITSSNKNVIRIKLFPECRKSIRNTHPLRLRIYRFGIINEEEIPNPNPVPIIQQSMCYLFSINRFIQIKSHFAFT